MKNRYLILAILCLTFSSAVAQKNHGKRFSDCQNKGHKSCILDDLNTEQKEKLKAEKVKFMAEIQGDKNKLGELKARMRTLSTTEPIDQKQLDKTLAEINKIHISIEKKRVRHHQSVKSLLTDEQVLAFDNKAQHRGRKGYGQRSRGMNKEKMHHSKKGKYNRGHQNTKESGFRANLSDEFKEQMKTSHLELRKQLQPLENKLGELNAQLTTQTTGKNVDLKKVDQIIDQKTTVKLEMSQLKSEMMTELRAQLNDEQKVWFDNRHRKHHYRMN